MQNEREALQAVLMQRNLEPQADLGEIDSDLNAVIMDYLISEGYPSAAQKFAHEANIAPMLDVDSVQERVDIREAINKGDIQLAIDKINELNPQVRPHCRVILLLPQKSIAMIIYCSCTTHTPLGVLMRKNSNYFSLQSEQCPFTQ